MLSERESEREGRIRGRERENDNRIERGKNKILG